MSPSELPDHPPLPDKPADAQGPAPGQAQPGTRADEVADAAVGAAFGAASGAAASGAATTGTGSVGPAPASANAPASRRGGGRALRAFGARIARSGANLSCNLGNAGLALLLRPRDAAAWRSGGGSLLALFVLHALVGLGYDLYASGWRDSHFDAYALPAVSFWALALLLGAGVLVALGQQRPSAQAADPAAATASPAVGTTFPSSAATTVLALATAGFALACWESLAASLLAVAADHLPAIDRTYPLLSWVPLLWAALAFAVLAARMAVVGGAARRTLVFGLALALMIAPQWAADPATRLWTGEAADDSVAVEGPDSPQSEQALYGQFDLLNDALDAIVPGQQGVTELFTISFAGDGTQDVFLNEAVGADAVMADVFDSGEHSLVLANSIARPQERPFATATALERALAEVADRMNLDEDVLAVFLTSHGTPDHHLSVSLPPYVFDDITPERLRSMLDEAGIRYRVIIVSSCYSGGFLAPLSGPDTMVITAAAPDRTSFGCRNGEQWTDFGRAYFAEALSQAASFEGAFRIAKGRIAEREAKEGLTPSEPQMFVGPGIREQLQRLETRRGGRILFAGAARRPAPEHTPSRQG